MAHSLDTKAQALALLALGNTPRHVAAQLGIPRTTVRRWQPEARELLRDLVGDGLADALGTIGGEMQQNGPKKKSGTTEHNA